MSNTDNVLKVAYQMVSEFLDLLSSRDKALLASKFDVQGAVYDEIMECLGDYYDLSEGLHLSPPPFDEVLKGNDSPDFIFTLFEKDDPGVFGVECILWNNGEPTEPISNFDLENKQGVFVLSYNYTGS